jgi:fructoselysine-6-P-deglycase FrlB-like protein
VAAGPEESVAFVCGTCVLTEALNIHAPPNEASEFFHGTIEFVNEDTSIVLFLGEDCSRPLMERFQNFCLRFGHRSRIYDSRDYAMEGVDSEIRKLVAPLIVQAAFGRFSVYLAKASGKDFATRKYMRKVEYWPS